MKKLFKKNKKLIIIISAVLVLLLAVGSYIVISHNDKSDNTKSSEKGSNKKKTAKKEELKIVDVNSTSRPYAVMINNISVARPLQSGLQDAYIMYEMIVEGGITRYLALFLDQNTERIGSIRSARHYYIDYALENDAIYVYHGYSPTAGDDIKRLGVDNIQVGDKTGWRDKSLKVSSEHTLFTNIEKLGKGMNGKRTERKGDLLLDYSAKSLDLASIANSKVANKVSITYSNSTTSSYEYDPEAKVYKRYVNGREHTDYVTKKQYTFKNIITYQVENVDLNDGGTKGRQDLRNIGNGTGWYISEGYAVPITWEKTSREAKTVYKLEDGTKLKVNDGNTFIQIQPTGRTLTIE